MANFSAQDLQDVALQLNSIGMKVGIIRLNAIHNGSSLSDPQIRQLLGWNLGLMNLAASFAGQAAEVSLADAQGAMNTIKVATATADAALDRLTLVDKVINIAADVTVLATAVFTGDTGQIAKAAKGVYDAATT